MYFISVTLKINININQSIMPDHKQLCKSCKTRHLPPTGKKCQKKREDEHNTELLRDAAVAGSIPASQSNEGDGQLLQQEILQQLQKVSQRLEQVEERMSTAERTSTPQRRKLSTDSCCESVRQSKSKSCIESVKQSRSKRSEYVSSSSSSDESDEPSLSLLKSEYVQRKVDKRIRELNQNSRSSGKLKYKSLRGGDVDVQVKHKVHWPHEAILSGVTRQRVPYDQLSLTQWVNGFCRNILEEKSESRKDIMISYLGDLMEDATDFSWQGAKAAHAVLLCEMERGSLKWEDTDRVDRVRRAHAQKHIPSGKQNWVRADKKPWFCKNYQTNSCHYQKDHEVNGRLNRHICAFCLTLGKQLGHSEKNCNNKTNNPKNDQPAAHR